MPTFGTLVVLKKGGAPGPHFPIRRRNCVFGSLVECEICIKRDEVQERHARIEVQGVSNFFYILNLANDGGVLINDVAMSGGQKLQLADKDVITICGRKFSIEIPGMNQLLLHTLHDTYSILADIVDKENVSENVGLATPGKYHPPFTSLISPISHLIVHNTHNLTSLPMTPHTYHHTTPHHTTPHHTTPHHNQHSIHIHVLTLTQETKRKRKTSRRRRTDP